MICHSTKLVVWIRLLLIPTLFIGAFAIPADGSATCQIPNFSCDRDCAYDSKNFQPQRCGSCCPKNGGGETASLTSGDSTDNRLARVENTVADLKVMIGVLLALVVLLIFAVVVLFLHQCNKIPSSFDFLFQKDKTSKTEKTAHKNCNGVTANGTVSRLANHQSKTSPQTKRSSLNRSISLSTEVETPSRPYRIRQPSESTCPEEGDDINSPRGYDNLALSTSTIDTTTLHNTSNSSTDTLGPALSTHTLQTTLPSDPHFNSHAHNNTPV